MTSKPAVSLADTAYARIKWKIIFQDLAGGQAVDELSLAAELELGRTPVREAIQRLAREGLLRVIPRKGTIVTELSLDTVREMFEARAPCEAQIARLAALRAEPAEIAMMEAALVEVDRFIDERRFRELLIADEQFHLKLAAAAKNRLLQEILIKLYGLGVRFWYATLTVRPAEEIKLEMRRHLEVVETIKRRDPEKAAQAVLGLIDGFPDRVSELIHGGLGLAPERRTGRKIHEREIDLWETQSSDTA